MSDDEVGRTVDLVVVDGDGEVRGRLPTFQVGTPWWQDIEPIVARHPAVVVLRLLGVAPGSDQRQRSRVSYLVESEQSVPELLALDRAGEWPGTAEDALDPLLADHPLRMPWARPGGPAEDLDWAAGHVHLTGPPRQVRSWNLSAIWELPTAGGSAWLKCVPPFFGHEASVISALGPAHSLPHVIAAEDHRILLEAMPGEDGYGADSAGYRGIISELLQLQAELLGSTPSGGGRDRLRSVPEWSAERMGTTSQRVIDRHRHQLLEDRRGGPSAMRTLEGLLLRWDSRWSAVDSCGLPDTLFHGDLHPGNARIGVHPPVLFDWGDSGWGHPLLDLAVVSSYHTDQTDPAAVLEHWLEGWNQLAPGSDPVRAWSLLRPVARLRTALVFQNFVDSIEPTERPYHRDDVLEGLIRTVAALDRDADGPSLL